MNRRSLPCFALWFMPSFHRPLSSGLAVDLFNDSVTMEKEGSWVEVFSLHSGHSLRSSRWFFFWSFSTNVLVSSNNNNKIDWISVTEMILTGCSSQAACCVLKAYTGLNWPWAALLLCHHFFAGCSRWWSQTGHIGTITSTTAATWKAHLLTTILCRCPPPFKEGGGSGEVKREGGKEGCSPWANARQRWQ